MNVRTSSNQGIGCALSVPCLCMHCFCLPAPSLRRELRNLKGRTCNHGNLGKTLGPCEMDSYDRIFFFAAVGKPRFGMLYLMKARRLAGLDRLEWPCRRITGGDPPIVSDMNADLRYLSIGMEYGLLCPWSVGLWILDRIPPGPLSDCSDVGNRTGSPSGSVMIMNL
ncbi:hypothetical protein BDV10DRAFT_31442 [Aspergillus recurvatus]